ncbi:hypothetical protein Taro_021029 [Colocasia esculenta]|uniref:J domain-containing protein n=1 Tax=Colocasia esculenta TaxID=4460 RepID=A0A843V709_COLES|nr:hypothetical protein [Colocasia esculenta]
MGWAGPRDSATRIEFSIPIGRLRWNYRAPPRLPLWKHLDFSLLPPRSNASHLCPNLCEKHKNEVAGADRRMVRLLVPLVICTTFALFVVSPEAKSLDPYKGPWVYYTGRFVSKFWPSGAVWLESSFACRMGRGEGVGMWDWHRPLLHPALAAAGREVGGAGSRSSGRGASFACGSYRKGKGAADRLQTLFPLVLSPFLLHHLNPSFLQPLSHLLFFHPSASFSFLLLAMAESTQQQECSSNGHGRDLLLSSILSSSCSLAVRNKENGSSDRHLKSSPISSSFSPSPLDVGIIVLGVDKNASQRDIQKAFHKLSLQYHPDKNKNKGAQERFAEINNAYEILSDEEKKKNYDLYGDEKGAPGFDGGNFGGGNFGSREGYTYFTSGGPGDSRHTFKPGGWQQMGGQGNAKTYSFSFGGDPGVGSGSFDFGFGDLFSNFFGGHSRSGNQFGSFSGSSGANSGTTHRVNIQEISWQTFKKEIMDQGLTWLLLFYTPTSRGYDAFESVIQDTANSLQGALKAGKVDCQREQALCKDLGVWPSKSARVFVYSYKSGEKGSLVEYDGKCDSRSLKAFCQEQLPRFSKRVSLSRFTFPSNTKGNLPQVLLLSTKKDTPTIWRVLSGLYHKRIIFYDAEVHDVSDDNLRRFRVDALPAVVGRLSNDEEYTLKTGISIKDLSTGISEMKKLLDSFEKQNKKVSSNQGKKSSQTETKGTAIPYVTSSNMDTHCGDKAPLCIIGVFRSLKAKDKVEQILSLILHLI